MKLVSLFPLVLLGIAQAAPAPAGEARRHMNRGRMAMKEAKTPEDFTTAGKEFDAASEADPKLAEAPYNAGVAYENAGDAATAMTRFKTYLERAPKARDAQAVKDRIDGLEFKAEKASDATGAWRSTEPLGDYWEKHLGKDWCEFIVEKGKDGAYSVRPFKTVYADGDNTRNYSISNVRIEGRRFRFDIRYRLDGPGMSLESDLLYDLTLSPDGQRFEGAYRSVCLKPSYVCSDSRNPSDFTKKGAYVRLSAAP